MSMLPQWARRAVCHAPSTLPGSPSAVSSLDANSPTSRLVEGEGQRLRVVGVEAGEQREYLLPNSMTGSAAMHGLVEALGRRCDSAPRGRLLGHRRDQPPGVRIRLEEVGCQRVPRRRGRARRGSRKRWWRTSRFCPATCTGRRREPLWMPDRARPSGNGSGCPRVPRTDFQNLLVGGKLMLGLVDGFGPVASLR